VVAAAAYRLGDSFHEMEVDQTHDYRRRGGVEATLNFAPADAPSWALDPEQLWNAANAAEKRKNSTLAREVELALPAAVSSQARVGIVRDFSAALVERYGVAVSVGIHGPSRAGDQRNHHAHILFTTRRMDADGLGAKTRVLDDRKTGPQEVHYLRALACDLINAALADAGSDERVDHRSFAARGIDKEPTTHLGPAGKALERREERSDRTAINDEVATENRFLDALVAELAAIDAEIAEAEERKLDDRFGELDDAADVTVLPEVLPPVQFAEVLLDDFEGVRHETVDQVEEPTSEPDRPPPEVASAAQSDFNAVHNQTIVQAIADQVVIDEEESGDGGGGFRRVAAWWKNLTEHFVGWRDHLQERFNNFRSRQPSPPGSRDEIEH
jgi:ATP-dependent exoDNAse (exonuclease V) alpha subunit